MTDHHDERAEHDSPLYNDQRIWVIVTYVLHLFGAVLALPSIVGLVMNYVLRDNALPTQRSHHDWMIHTFWWALAWTVVTWLLWITFIGIPVAIILGCGIWLWWMYRHVRGLIRLSDHLPMSW